MNDAPLIAGFEPFQLRPRPGEVGFKFRISLKKLGRNLNKLRKSPALQGALRLADKAMKNPVLAQAIPPQYRLGIAAGIATLRVKDKADAGDPQAQAVLAQAESGNASEGARVVSNTEPAAAVFCPTCGQVLP